MYRTIRTFTPTPRDLTAEREYDSGYADGKAGLAWLPNESAAYYDGFEDGRRDAGLDR